MAVSREENVQWTRAVHEHEFEISASVVGREIGEESKASILNSIVRATDEGLTYDADAVCSGLLLEGSSVGLEAARFCWHTKAMVPKTHWAAIVSRNTCRSAQGPTFSQL